MKKKHMTVLLGIFCLAALLVVGAFKVQAGSSEPGSTTDPLVTKSFVEDVLNKKTELKVVELTTGQTLEGKAGAELILRGGKALISIKPGAQGGLSDVTGGKDLNNGATAPLNHLMIVARSDGRGLKAQSKVWVTVRGEYEIK